MANIDQGYDSKCKDGSGGLKNVYLFSFENYNRSEITTNGNILTSFPETTIYGYEYVSDPVFANKMQEEAGGKYYDENISIELSKVDVDLNLRKLLKKDVRIIVLDKNGKYRILGAYKGLECTGIKASIGTSRTTLNGYDISFEGKEERESLYIDDLFGTGFTIDGQEPPPPTVSYPGSTGRFSLEDISDGANPIVAKVKSGTEAAQDFTAIEWLDGTLLAYCATGDNDGILQGIYEQESGDYWEVNNQTVKVVESGVILTLDGRPCWRMVSGSWITTTGSTVMNTLSIFTKHKNNALTNLIQYLVFSTTPTDGGLWTGGTFSGATGIGFFSNPSFISSTVEDLNSHYVSCISDGVDLDLYVDGNLEVSGVSRSLNVNLISRNQANLTFIGDVCEIVLYDTDEATDRVVIETKINR